MNETTITIVGNLTEAPELRVSPQGVSLVRFTVASTPRVWDKTTGGFRDGEPLFLACTAWRDLAENLAESLHKGTRVVVRGRLTQSTWQTETGEKRTAYGVQVDDLGASLRFATATITKTGRRQAAATT